MDAIHRWILGWVIVISFIACAPFVPAGLFMVYVVLTTRSGIGDVEQAKRKIKPGMTKDEVHSLLGSPHSTGACGGDEWDYWQTKFVGSILRVHFGPDGRVTSYYCWVQ